MFKKHARWLLPLLLFLVYTPFSGKVDLAFARYFYDPQQEIFKGTLCPFADFVYQYGESPAFIAWIVACLLLVGSYFYASLKKWFKPTLVLALTLIIGAGLITNIILKNSWGRPRPRQVAEFGGTQHFRPYYHPILFPKGEQFKSFPSGHAVMGFYFLTFFLLGQRHQQKWVAWTGLLIGLGFGAILGWTRMSQGGHFFTDVIFAALVMWWTALTFCWLIYDSPYRQIKT